LQLVAIDAAGAPKLIDMGAIFGIAAGGVLTLFIAAPPVLSASRTKSLTPPLIIVLKYD